MVRPQHLRAIAQLDGLERLLAVVLGGEGDVIGRVPVLRQDNILKALGDRIDERHDRIALFNRQTAARGETVLYVDDQQRIAVSDFDLVGCKGAAQRRAADGRDRDSGPCTHQKLSSGHLVHCYLLVRTSTRTVLVMTATSFSLWAKV